MLFRSDLTAGEMLEQIYAIERDTGIKVTNVVIMGCGEPLDNYRNSIRFIKMISDEKGANIGRRRITLSTCGLTEKIKYLADEMLQITLAVSLHAPNDTIRNKLMPVSKKNPLDGLLHACFKYHQKTGRRVTFEYALIGGVNDTAENAEELCRKLAGLSCHVNILNINETPGRSFKKSGNTHEFISILEKNGQTCSLRGEKGADIDAACGQLRKRFMQEEL